MTCHCPSLETGGFYHVGTWANKTLSCVAIVDALRTMTMNTHPISVQGFELTGASLGGIETYATIPQLRLAIDVGRGPRELVRCEHIALTHTHVDHCAGLAYLVAMRSFFRLEAPTIYAPEACIADLQTLVTNWNRLQRVDADAHFVPMSPGKRVRLRKDIELSAFRTRHPVPSLGYTVTHRVDKLAAAFQGKPGHELKELKAQGTVITETRRKALISVSGDTLVEVIDDVGPELMKSHTVLLECTFLDDAKPYEAARKGGHIHLRDLMARADALSCDRLILSHFSQLYEWPRVAELLRPLAAAIKGELWAWPMLPGQRPVQVKANAP